MLYSQRQPLKTRQFDITHLYLTVAGSSTPTGGGIDKKLIDKVEKLSTGVFKIHLKSKARRPLFSVGVTMITEDSQVVFVASDTGSITFKCFVAGVADDDCDFAVTVGYHDNTTLY